MKFYHTMIYFQYFLINLQGINLINLEESLEWIIFWKDYILKLQKLITEIIICDSWFYFLRKKCSYCMNELSCLPAAIARHISSMSIPWETQNGIREKESGQRPVSRIPNTFNVRVPVRIPAVCFAPMRYPSRAACASLNLPSPLVISRMPRRYRVARTCCTKQCNMMRQWHRTRY